MKSYAITAVAAALLLTSPLSVNSSNAYDPVIIPADFTTVIDNPLFSMPDARKTYFRGQTDEGPETGEILVTGATRFFMGVRTLVLRDRVYLNGVLKEEALDYVAQHKNGAVWYFGEDVDNYEDGVLVDHHGTWHAGVKGALPGILMLASPKVGQVYREEYFPGKAEDMAKVLSVTETVRTPLGFFTNCLKTENWTPLEPGVKENKFYCAQAGGLVQEIGLSTGERSVLYKIKNCF